jgi:hypothetical protein
MSSLRYVLSLYCENFLLTHLYQLCKLGIFWTKILNGRHQTKIEPLWKKVVKISLSERTKPFERKLDRSGSCMINFLWHLLVFFLDQLEMQENHPCWNKKINMYMCPFGKLYKFFMRNCKFDETQAALIKWWLTKLFFILINHRWWQPENSSTLNQMGKCFNDLLKLLHYFHWTL